VRVRLFQKPQVLRHLAGRAEKLEHGTFAVLPIMDEVVATSFDGTHFGNRGVVREFFREELAQAGLNGTMQLALRYGGSSPITE